MKRLNKDDMKKQLLDLVAINNAVDIEELNETAVRIEKPKDTAGIIREYEEILCAKKGHCNGCVLPKKIWKRFKEIEKFQEMVGKSKNHKSTIIFKINVFNLIEKHLKLMRSSVTLTFLKNYLKDIREVCEDNLNNFKSVKFICFRKLSFLKCLDKLFCKHCKIFKAHASSCRVNLVLTHFS